MSNGDADRSFLFVAVIVGALLSSIAYAQTGATAQAVTADDRNDPYLSEIQSFARTFDISEAEAREYGELTETVGQLDDAAKESFPDTFGGLSRDPRTGVITLYFKRGAAQAAAGLAARFDLPRDRVRGLHGNYTVGELDQLVAQITAELPTLATQGYKVAQVWSDLSSNSVVIGVEGDNAQRASLASRYGDGVRVEHETVSRSTACVCPPDNCTSRFTCAPYLRGGIELIGSDGYVCTAGFNAWRNSTPVLFTAGHCFANTARVVHSGIVLGNPVARQFSGTVDGEVISLTTAWTPTNKVYYSDGNKNYLVRKRAGFDFTETTGTSVCRTGITTGPSCGVVTSLNATVNIVNDAGTVTTTLTQQRRAALCSLPGDSGGPITYGGAAHGVNSAGNFIDQPNGDFACNSQPTSTYSGLVNSSAALGMSIRIS